MKPIRTVLVGLGAMGRNWLRVIQSNRRFELVGTVDVDRSRVVDGVMTWQRALDVDIHPEVDAWIVATPTGTHCEAMSAVLVGSKPTLVEKPLASTVTECRSIIRKAARERSPLVVGHVERFNPAVVALGNVIASGRIGTPIHYSVTRVGGYPSAVTPGSAVTLDLAVHDLDILSRLMGPLGVKASVCHASVRSDVCDTAEILLEAVDGASATVHVNWITPVKVRTMRVTGTHGVAFVDLIAQAVEIASSAGRVAVEVKRAEPLALQLDAFADYIETGVIGNLASGEEATRAVVLAEEALVMGARRAAVVTARDCVA